MVSRQERARSTKVVGVAFQYDEMNASISAPARNVILSLEAYGEEDSDGSF